MSGSRLPETTVERNAPTPSLVAFACTNKSFPTAEARGRRSGRYLLESQNDGDLHRKASLCLSIPSPRARASDEVVVRLPRVGRPRAAGPDPAQPSRAPRVTSLVL